MGKRPRPQLCQVCEEPCKTLDVTTEKLTDWIVGAKGREAILSLLAQGTQRVRLRLIDCPTCGRYPVVMLPLPPTGARYLRQGS